MKTQIAIADFQEEYGLNTLKRTDWAFVLVIAIIFAVYSLVMGIMSTFPVPEPTEDGIRAYQERAATILFGKKPKDVVEPATESAAPIPDPKLETVRQRAQERIQERSGASAADRKTAQVQNQAAREAARNQAAKAVSNIGALARLTALGEVTAGEEEVEDLIGQGGIKTSNLGKALASLDGLRTNGYGARRPGHRTARGTDGITNRGDIEDLITGITSGPSYSLKKKLGISLRKPIIAKNEKMKSAHRSLEAINEVIRNKLGAIQYCYKKQLTRHPGLSGKITVRFTIGPVGRVTAARTIHSDIRQAALGQCLLKTIRRLQFKEIPAKEGSMSVTYPFVFTGS
jgi:TonB family protein